MATLKDIRPDLLAEWDYKKNDVSPDDISVGVHKRIWWRCPFGHSYQTYIYNRTGSSHTGCPICDKENHTSFPEQALYFYIRKAFPEALNGDMSEIGMELDIYIDSIKTAVEYDGGVWHKNAFREMKKNKLCTEHGIRLIRVREPGLPLYDDCICVMRSDKRSADSLNSAIKKVLDILGVADSDVDTDRDAPDIYGLYIITRKSHNLLATYPEIAAEWHPTKNGALSPDMVAPGTQKKVWWLGKCGHEWQMDISDRTNQNCGCPICSGKRIISGINDLQTKYPELCKEWDYEKNNKEGLFPDKIAPHSDKKAWWKCSKCGYEWKAKIDSRTRMKAGCPMCGIGTSAKAKHKPVRCIETGIVYSSIKEAAEDVHISPAAIVGCCKGYNKSAAGYHWEYSSR